MKKPRYEKPIGMFTKKHFCPKCSGILSIEKRKKTVNSESEEAKDFDFTTTAGDCPTRLLGDIEFTWHVYCCANCDIEITDDDMRRYEHRITREKERTLELIIFIIVSIVALLIYSLAINKVEESGKSDKIRSIDTMNKTLKVKYLHSANPFYVYFKRHYCPNCSSIMSVDYKSNIVNSDSAEAQFYDFSLPDGKLTGNVEFRTAFFQCQNCNFEISFEEMKKLEKENVARYK